jgi:hypothetical protein
MPLMRREFLQLSAAIIANFSLESLASRSPIIDAANFISSFCQTQTQQTKKPIIFAPHADYTHFNLIGDWDFKKQILQDRVDIGLSDTGLLKQRAEAIRSGQPIESDVSIEERALVTLANLRGRKRVPGKLIVAKHFPGGPSEIETTEGTPYIMRAESSDLERYLLPFKTILPEAEAIMVCHASYPAIDLANVSPFEKQMAKEVQALGVNPDFYSYWQKNRPATFSPAVIRGLLKKKLNFSGAVISDAMYMGATIRNAEEMMTQTTGVKYSGTLINILATYAGIDYFLLGGIGELNKIASHAKHSPLFRQCLENSYENYVAIHQKIGITSPNETSLLGKARALYGNATLGNAWSDVWEGSGYLHQLFRRSFTASMKNDDTILKNRKKFMTAQPNWKKINFTQALLNYR